MSIRTGNAALTIGIRLDQAGINGKAFAADKALVHATMHRLLENVAQQIALAKAAMTVLGKR